MFLKDSYHAKRVHVGHKELEKLIIEGLDRTKVSGKGVRQRNLQSLTARGGGGCQLSRP